MNTQTLKSYCSNFQKVQTEVTTVKNPHFKLYPVESETEIYVSRYDFRVRKVTYINVLHVLSTWSKR